MMRITRAEIGRISKNVRLIDSMLIPLREKYKRQEKVKLLEFPDQVC
jgi:hypothetical protein